MTRQLDRYLEPLLDEERFAFYRAVCEFSEREIAPHILQWEREHILIPPDTISKMGELGLFGLTVSEESESLGNVREPMDLVNPHLLKWLSFDPFEVEGCRECEFLPICLGACPKRTIEGEDPTQGNSCKYIKRNIDTILLLHGT